MIALDVPPRQVRGRHWLCERVCQYEMSVGFTLALQLYWPNPIGWACIPKNLISLN